MLYGGYDHNVDKKGRVFIPAKFRDDLGESFMICRGISGKRCLCIYPFSEWEKLVAKISELPVSQSSTIKRFIFDGAFSVEFDAQGRVLVPAQLREYSKLLSNAHLIGMDKYVELWASELWEDEDKFDPEEILADVDKFQI